MSNDESVIEIPATIPTKDELDNLATISKTKYKQHLKQQLRKRVAETSESAPCFFTLWGYNHFCYPPEVRKAAADELGKELNATFEYTAMFSPHEDNLLVLVNSWMTEKRCAVESRIRTIVAGFGPAALVAVVAIAIFVFNVTQEVCKEHVPFGWLFFFLSSVMFVALFTDASSRLARTDEQRKLIARAKMSRDATTAHVIS